MATRFVLATAALIGILGCRGDRPATPHMKTTATARQQALPQPIRLVTLGDSLAYGTGDEAGKGIAGRIQEFAPEVQTINLGVNGAQTSDLIGKLGEQRFRDRIANADVIVLSIGANDLWRTQRGQQEVMKDPIGVATRVLDRIDDIVNDLHQAAPHARILILGGYNPVPAHPLSPMIDHYLEIWNTTLAERFKHDALVAVVKMDDIVTPKRLSRFDHFHPGGAAYDDAAKRIAAMITA